MIWKKNQATRECQAIGISRGITGSLASRRIHHRGRRPLLAAIIADCSCQVCSDHRGPVSLVLALISCLTACRAEDTARRAGLPGTPWCPRAAARYHVTSPVTDTAPDQIWRLSTPQTMAAAAQISRRRQSYCLAAEKLIQSPAEVSHCLCGKRHVQIGLSRAAVIFQRHIMKMHELCWSIAVPETSPSQFTPGSELDYHNS